MLCGNPICRAAKENVDHVLCQRCTKFLECRGGKSFKEHELGAKCAAVFESFKLLLDEIDIVEQKKWSMEDLEKMEEAKKKLAALTSADFKKAKNVNEVEQFVDTMRRFFRDLEFPYDLARARPSPRSTSS